MSLDWSDVPTEKRQETYRRWATGENDVVTLARELGLPPQNLSRRLREMRQFKTGESWTGGTHPDTVLPTSTANDVTVATPTVPWLPQGTPWAPYVFPHQPTTSASATYVPPAIPKKSFMLANPTDVHGVYADPYAWELALKCIELMNPDHITWGNDAMDFGSISNYSRVTTLPTVKAELDDEKLRRKELLTAAPHAEIWWLADNHVYERYRRYMYNRIPEMADIDELALHKILGVPEDHMVEHFNAGKTLRVIHGTVVRKWPGWSVVAEIFDNPSNRDGRMTRSIMMGHIHRFSYVAFDNNIEGLECGCLCSLRPEYIVAQRQTTNWSHGMGFAQYGEDWSRIIPARFYTSGDQLICHLEGKELKVKTGPSYTGYL